MGVVVARFQVTDVRGNEVYIEADYYDFSPEHELLFTREMVTVANFAPGAWSYVLLLDLPGAAVSATRAVS